MTKKSTYKQETLFNQTSFQQVNLLDELAAIEQGIPPLEPCLFNLSDIQPIEQQEPFKPSPLPLGSYQGFFVIDKISPLEYPRNIL